MKKFFAENGIDTFEILYNNCLYYDDMPSAAHAAGFMRRTTRARTREDAPARGAAA